MNQRGNPRKRTPTIASGLLEFEFFTSITCWVGGGGGVVTATGTGGLTCTGGGGVVC